MYRKGLIVSLLFTMLLCSILGGGSQISADTSTTNIPVASLAGPASVQSGETFNLTYRLANATQPLFAQDVTFTYDSEKLDLISVSKTNDKIVIVDEVPSRGQIRIILAAMEGNQTNGDWLKLRFTAKQSVQVPTSKVEVKLSNIMVANANGVESQLVEVSHNVRILNGIGPGDLNGDGKYTVGDLAIAAFAYGKTSSDPDWDLYQSADLNNDGIIDIEDLAILVQKMLLGTEAEAPVLDYMVNRSFNGTSDFEEHLSDVGQVSGLTQGSIVAKIRTGSTAVAKTILSASDTNEPSSNITLAMNNGTIHYEIRENGVFETELNANGTFNDSNWHTVVLTVDSSGTKLYVDGLLNTTHASNKFFSHVKELNGLWVGQNVDNGGGQWFYNGDISFVKVYSKALLADEIFRLSTDQEISQSQMTATASSFEPGDNPANALDGDPATLWHTLWNNTDTVKELTIDLGESYTPSKLTYLPRQDESSNGRITGYEIYTSEDGTKFTKASNGTWANDKNLKTSVFASKTSRYVKLKAIASGGGFASAAEIRIYALGGDGTPSIPSGLTAKSTSSSQVRINWNPSEATVSYDIEADGTVIENVNSPYVHSGLAEGSTHSYRVRAVNSIGPSKWSAPFTATTFTGNAIFDEQMIFDIADGKGYAQYRIPSIAVTANGTVVVAAEARSGGDQTPTDIVVKRSTDGGNTFSEQVILAPGKSQGNAEMNPMLLAENTGNTVHLIWGRWTWGNCKFYIRTSNDNGLTWGDTKDITYVLDSYKNPSSTNYFANLAAAGMGPGHGIQLVDGTLVVPIYMTTNNWVNSTVATIYSNDNGVTWNAGTIVPNPAGYKQIHENMMVQLSNGNLMTNMRNPGSDYRAVSTSSGVTGTWSTPYTDRTLIDPIVMASIQRYDSTTILFSNPANMTTRTNMTIRMSKDDAATWYASKEVYAGDNGYSDIGVGPDKMIYLFYEKPASRKIALARFNKEWVEQK